MSHLALLATATTIYLTQAQKISDLASRLKHSDDQVTAIQTQLDALDKPKIIAQISTRDSAEIISKNGKFKGTFFFFVVRIRDVGAPSIVDSYALHLDCTIGSRNFTPQAYRSLGTSSFVDLHQTITDLDKADVWNKTYETPIPHNGSVPGSAEFIVPGIHRLEIDACKPNVYLLMRDVNGAEVRSATYPWWTTTQGVIPYVPGGPVPSLPR